MSFGSKLYFVPTNIQSLINGYFLRWFPRYYHLVTSTIIDHKEFDRAWAKTKKMLI
jgi:hypothetical protein